MGIGRRLEARLKAALSLCTGVVFFLLVTSASAANLTSLVVSPASPALPLGQTQALGATGSFDDGSVRSLTPAVPLAVGERHACVVLVDGGVNCWGANGNGQLGNGSLANSNVPVAVSGISTATGVGVGTGVYHSCARLANGQVRCWGHNANGQLGNGSFANSTTPVPVSGVSDANAVATGAYHTCAALADGTARCWGGNSTGQLGNGLTVDSSTPAVVTGVSTARAITAGYYHTCALLAGGSVRCWGYNGNGQLGDGTFSNSSTPVTPLGLSPAIGISAGAFHTCALLADGSIRCWGFNAYGQLGNGTFTGSGFPTPVVPTGASPAVAVGAGAFHTCAVMANGSAQCWGYNGTGQLGNGTLTNSATPASVSGLPNAAAVAGGYFHSCAVLVDGAARCWGNNGVGQLGTGNFTNSTTPVAVSGVSAALVVRWSSGDPSVATIDASGLVTALSAGTSIMTGRVLALTAGTTVTVHPATSHLTNLSTRAFVGVGTNAAVAGFIISGTGTKQVLIRGFGPTLLDFGVTGALANPILELYWDNDNDPRTPAVLVLTNNDWGTAVTSCPAPVVACGTPSAITATGLSADSYAPSNPNRNLDAAMLLTLPTGTYTATLRSADGGTGAGLVGVDDLDTDRAAKLANISTRALVTTGSNPAVGGFIVTGNSSKQVLIRGFGPTLTSFGLSGVLANPTLDLFWDDDNNPATPATLVMSNDDWGTALATCPAPVVSCGAPQDIRGTGLSADSYAPANANRALDAALLVTLPPGTYTARLRGTGTGTGIGLVGVDEVALLITP